jgi:hypothetical protein
LNLPEFLVVFGPMFCPCFDEFVLILREHPPVNDQNQAELEFCQESVQNYFRKFFFKLLFTSAGNAVIILSIFSCLSKNERDGSTWTAFKIIVF